MTPKILLSACAAFCLAAFMAAGTAAAADIVCDCVYLLKGTEESSDDE